MHPIDEVIYNLKTIATINVGDRISTSKRFIMVDPAGAPMQFMWRTLRSDSRDRAINAICGQIQMGAAFVELLCESCVIRAPPDKVVDLTPDEVVVIVDSSPRGIRIDQLRRLYHALGDAKRGIESMCGTYEEDADARGKLVPLFAEIANAMARATALLLELGFPAEHL